MDQPLVSVVLITYRRSYAIVERALKSILSQTYTHLEIVVVDDNGDTDSQFSRDLTAGVDTIGDPRITIFAHETNRGACVARNTGMLRSRGDYIAFLDDDDQWLPEKISRQVEAFQSAPEVGLVYCDRLIQVGEKLIKRLPGRIIDGYRYEDIIYKNFIGSTSYVMIRREVVDTCGMFNEQMKSAQDSEYWARILKKYRIIGINEPLAIYYVHAGERITSSYENKIAGMEMFNALYHDDIVKRRKVHCRRTLILSPHYLKKYGFKKGMKQLWKAFVIYPNPFYVGKEVLLFLSKRLKYRL